MSSTGHDSQLGLVRGPIAAAAAIALTTLITALLPPVTVLADPPMPTPSAPAAASPSELAAHR